MAIGGDHEVAVRIRIGVHYHEGGFSPIEDEVFAVVFLGGEVYEDASLCGLGVFDVSESPGRPNAVCHPLTV